MIARLRLRIISNASWNDWLMRNFPLLLLLMIVAGQGYQMETMMRQFFATHNPYLSLALIHAMPIIGLFILLHYTAWHVTSRVVRGILTATWLLLLLVMIVDMAIFRIFFRRLDFQEVAVFAREGNAIIQMAWQIVTNPEFLYISIPFLAILSTPLILFISSAHAQTKGSLSRLRPILAVALLGSAAIGDSQEYAPDKMVNNVLEHQYKSRPSLPYSATYLNTLDATTLARETCVLGLNQTRDIVLVALESLSSYHSRWYSGIHDWLPEIDKLAQRHSASQNFVANGYRTDLGNV